jgi:hypothetical protein
MPLRLTLFLVALLLTVPFSFDVQAQNRAPRGTLASRNSSLRLYLSRSAPISRNVRMARIPRFAAQRSVTYNAPQVQAAPIARPIALGAYFYQNGQCAPGDGGAVSAYKARAGKMPAVWMIFQSWTGWNQFPIAQAKRARQLGGQLMVTWEPWNQQKNDPNWNCAMIAGGYKDTYIRRYARAVKKSGVPVMIRFAHEMNGDWYPWGTAFSSNFRRSNGNSPQHFVAMWRRVVDIFRQEGASNARWVWAPNIHFLNNYNSIGDQNRDLSELYPGDHYVDWIGLSVYNDASRRNWRTFSDLFGGAYQTVTAITHKPLMIAEMGVTEQGAPSGTSKAQWISQTLLNDIPARFPRVRLVNWFCRDKSNIGEANYRFDSSPSSLRAFRLAANSPLYGARLTGN